MSDWPSRRFPRRLAAEHVDGTAARGAPHAAAVAAAAGGAVRSGALLFLFPFYYMLIGSLQTEPDTEPARRRCPTRATSRCTTTAQIDGAINLGRTLFNSGIFTGGVLLGTVVFGLLAGYALAVLRVPRQGRRVRERDAGPGRARSSC